MKRHPWLAVLGVVALAAPARASVTFQLTFEDPGGAYSAYYAGINSNFLAAGNMWSEHFTSNASLQVVVRFTDSVVRASCPSITTALVSQSGGMRTYEQGAAREIRTGTDPNGSEYDMQLQLQPSYLAGLWFDPSPTQRTAAVPGDKTDAVSVFLHEIAHGIAFNGWRDHFTGSLPADYQSTYDKLVTFDGTNFWFNGTTADAYYGGKVPLTYGLYHHVGNYAPRPGSELKPDLMNGLVFEYGTRYYITPLDLRMIADTGLPTINLPEPGTLGPAVLAMGMVGMRRRQRRR
jgi:hypothetical protein